MKYIKSFENYSVNEEENLFTKVITGHENKEDKNKTKEAFFKQLDEFEEKVSKNPKDYSFNRVAIEKKAKENNYKGKLREQRGGRDERMFIIYDNGTSGLEKIGAGAGAVRGTKLYGNS